MSKKSFENIRLVADSKKKSINAMEEIFFTGDYKLCCTKNVEKYAYYTVVIF